MQFSGQIALVAGAGGGMGLAVANELIERGINVCMADVKPRPDRIATGPGESLYVEADLSQDADVARVVQEAQNRFGGIDYLANTLGVLWFDRDVSALDIDLDVWDRVMSINLRSIVLLAKHTAPLLKASANGAMVHFSSIDALSGDTRPQDAYGASKAALIRLSKSLAIQLAADGVRSNVILPGPTLTPMQDRWQGRPDDQQAVASHIPLGRLGDASDLANACLFLLSDNASYITGTELVVDGGITALP